LHPITQINPLNTELNPICHLLALLGAHHILHVSKIRVNMISNNNNNNNNNNKGKVKAIPSQAWRGPEGSRRLRLPDFKTIST
jgi:hypothetical protein